MEISIVIAKNGASRYANEFRSANDFAEEIYWRKGIRDPGVKFDANPDYFIIMKQSSEIVGTIGICVKTQLRPRQFLPIEMVSDLTVPTPSIEFVRFSLNHNPRDYLFITHTLFSGAIKAVKNLEIYDSAKENLSVPMYLITHPPVIKLFRRATCQEDLFLKIKAQTIPSKVKPAERCFYLSPQVKAEYYKIQPQAVFEYIQAAEDGA